MASLPYSADLFSTNRAPTSEEHESLTRLVTDFDEKVAGFTKAISELEEQIQRLTAEKAALLESAAPFKCALSPFRRLPDDILREIFVACLDSTRNPTMANTEAPVLLTQISSATRCIALSTPALWAAIHISIPGDVPAHFMDEAKSVMATRSSGVREWLLRRSGGMPLSISVHEPHGGYRPRMNELVREIIDILLLCCVRWRDVSFALLHTHASLKHVAALTPVDVPLLRSLFLDDRDTNPPMSMTHVWVGSRILGASNLVRFHMTLVRDMDEMSDYGVIWENITHLSLPEAPTWQTESDQVLDQILRQTTRLVSCNITVFHARATQIDDIQLPFLKVLVAQEFEGDSSGFPGILNAIRAPALDTIAYTTYIQLNLSPPSLIALLKQAPKVEELSLKFDTSSAILQQCLQLCPLLSVLRVSNEGGYHRATPGTDDTLLAKFVEDDIAQCLCPQLEYFRCEPMLLVSLERLHTFIMRKTGSIPHLKRWKAVIMTVSYDPIDSHLIDTFEAPVGMDLKLSFQVRPGFSSALSQGLRALDEADGWWPSNISLPILDSEE